MKLSSSPSEPIDIAWPRHITAKRMRSGSPMMLMMRTSNHRHYWASFSPGLHPPRNSGCFCGFQLFSAWWPVLSMPFWGSRHFKNLSVCLGKAYVRSGAERAGWGKGGLMLLGPGVDELPSNHEQPEVSFNWALCSRQQTLQFMNPLTPDPKPCQPQPYSPHTAQAQRLQPNMEKMQPPQTELLRRSL